MPHVARLNVAPVRSLALQPRDEIMLGPSGVVEDRRFFLVDPTDRLVDQLVAATMVQVQAWTDAEAMRLRLTFPDGTVVDEGVKLGHPIVGAIHGRTGVGHLVQGPWAAVLSAFLGRDVRLVRCDQPGGTRVGNPTTLVTDGSIDRLATVLGGASVGAGSVDPRRFRMLIELDGAAAHEEDTWIEGRIALGDAILRISGPIPRCAITTHDPDRGERDLDVLRAIRAYRGIAEGQHLMFGVYGEIERTGMIRVGDEVQVL